MEKKRNRAPLFVGLSVVIVMAVVVITIIIVRSNSPERRLQDQLDLGYKYLDELDYERAIVAFNSVLEIDPRNVKGYKGLIDAYNGLGDAEGFLIIYDLAEENLEQEVLEDIKDDITNELIEMIDKSVSDGNDQLAEEQIEVLKNISPEDAELYLSVALSDEQQIEESETPETPIEERYVIIKKITKHYESDGSMECSVSEYQYESFERLKIHTYSMEDPDWNYTDEYVYDNEGRLIKEYDDYTLIDMGIWITEYKYDEYGNCIELIDKVSEDDEYPWMSRFEYELDESGKPLKRTENLVGYEDAFHPVVVTYEYDENGQLVKEISHSPIDSVSDDDYYTIYEYDEDGMLFRSVTYKDFGHIITYDYDANGNVVKEYYDISSGKDYWIEYEYEYGYVQIS